MQVYFPTRIWISKWIVIILQTATPRWRTWLVKPSRSCRKILTDSSFLLKVSRSTQFFFSPPASYALSLTQSAYPHLSSFMIEYYHYVPAAAACVRRNGVSHFCFTGAQKCLPAYSWLVSPMTFYWRAKLRINLKCRTACPNYLSKLLHADRVNVKLKYYIIYLKFKSANYLIFYTKKSN